MAGYTTQYVDLKVVDHLNGVTTLTPPATLWVALTTVILLNTNTTMPLGVEMSGAGYARVAITNNNTFWSAAALNANGVATAHNTQPVAFPAATDSYPSLPGWAFLDDPINGNVWYAGPFTGTLGLPAPAQIPTIQIGDITMPASGVLIS